MAKKKPVSKSQANKVANFVKQQSNGGPAVPNGNTSNPVTEDDDNDESQGA